MKSLACKDLGIRCEYVAKGDTTNEVIGNASEHLGRSHPKSWFKMKNKSQFEMEAEIMPKIKEIT